MVKSRKYVVKRRFDDVPKRDDFEIVEYETPPLQDGEFLVKTEWVSVDPYMRARLDHQSTDAYDQGALQIGLVVESKNPAYTIGTRVLSHKGWCEYAVINPSNLSDFMLDYVNKIPDMKGLPNSLALGAVGMIGATAYFGLLEICKPKAGETIVVTGAAGAVGSLAGQMAKIKGCKVIGFAGSDDKVKWLEQELGFDKAFNYKTVDVQQALEKAAPDGVDCYFDNVGGEISSIILKQMNRFGRISVCGSISGYSDYLASRALSVQFPMVIKELKMEGFIVTRWKEQWPEAFEEIIKWIKSGQLKVPEHVTEGFENIFDAFVGMLNGENKGKAIIKI